MQYNAAVARRARARPRTRREIADRLHSAAIHLLRRLRREDVAAGLPPARLSALSALVFAGPRTLSELAEAEQVRPPTMSRIVAGLEKEGLVRREPDRRDRRAVQLRATARGVRVLRAGRRRRIRTLVEMLRRLPAPEVQKLSRAAEILESLLGTDRKR